jgi:hypothetical protein
MNTEGCESNIKVGQALEASEIATRTKLLRMDLNWSSLRHQSGPHLTNAPQGQFNMGCFGLTQDRY